MYIIRCHFHGGINSIKAMHRPVSLRPVRTLIRGSTSTTVRLSELKRTSRTWLTHIAGGKGKGKGERWSWGFESRRAADTVCLATGQLPPECTSGEQQSSSTLCSLSQKLRKNSSHIGPPHHTQLSTASPLIYLLYDRYPLPPRWLPYVLYLFLDFTGAHDHQFEGPAVCPESFIDRTSSARLWYHL